MTEFNKTIKKKMIDAGLESSKTLAKETGMKYDTFLVRMKDPATFRVYEIRMLAEVLNLSNEELIDLIRGE